MTKFPQCSLCFFPILCMSEWWELNDAANNYWNYPGWSYQHNISALVRMSIACSKRRERERHLIMTHADTSFIYKVIHSISLFNIPRPLCISLCASHYGMSRSRLYQQHAKKGRCSSHCSHILLTGQRCLAAAARSNINRAESSLASGAPAKVGPTEVCCFGCIVWKEFFFFFPWPNWY